MKVAIEKLERLLTAKENHYAKGDFELGEINGVKNCIATLIATRNLDSKPFVELRLKECLEQLNRSNTWNNEDLDSVISDTEYLLDSLKKTKECRNS